MFSLFMCSFQYGVFLSRTGHYDDKTYKCRNVHFFDKSIIEMGLGMAGLKIRPRKKRVPSKYFTLHRLYTLQVHWVHTQ